jgi:hypothetical protein
MVQLYGQSWTRQQLQAYAGNTDQLASVRLGELADGRGRGVRVADCDTGGGLSFSVLLDRGMDIGAARYRGVPLAFQTNGGVAAPAYYEPQGLGWLRTFHGGLLAGCGMTYAGAPTVDQGEALGLHGRLNHLPAEGVWADAAWRGDEYELWVRGRMREAVMFGENVSCERRIWARLGERRLFLRDVVTNEGLKTTPHMMLYHCNFGFPLLAEGAQLLAPSRTVIPRDDVAAPTLAQHAVYEAPQPNYAECVYYHDMIADGQGYVTMVLANRAFGGGKGLGIYLKYRQAELPRFVQWKNVCAGTYVTGLEPSNCWVEGRDKDRERGILQFLEPGEQREYLLEIGVLDCAAEIDAWASRILKP